MAKSEFRTAFEISCEVRYQQVNLERRRVACIKNKERNKIDRQRRQGRHPVRVRVVEREEEIEVR